ncbi:MAG: nitroreductase family protein [Micrococcales bacterium]
MQKTAITAAPVLPAIANRWSPRAFDENYEISQHDLLSILEAGRWAPSAMNGQPWRFSVAVKGDHLFDSVRGAFSGFNQEWSKRASSLIVISIKNQREDGSPYPIASFDAGLAAQNMMIQSTEVGLAAHPISGIDIDAMHKVLDLADDLTVIAALVIGKTADAKVLEGTPAYEREIQTRVRHDLDDIVLHGKP